MCFTLIFYITISSVVCFILLLIILLIIMGYTRFYKKGRLNRLNVSTSVLYVTINGLHLRTTHKKVDDDGSLKRIRKLKNATVDISPMYSLNLCDNNNKY